MTGTRINSLGPVVESTRDGTQLDYHVSSSGMMPFRAQATQAITATTTASVGFQTISGAAAVTVVMPGVANNVGAIYSFRSLSTHAHIITGSLETAGVQSLVFGVVDGGLGNISGSKVTFLGQIGDHITFMGDGNKWFRIAGSGSFSGT